MAARALAYCGRRVQARQIMDSLVRESPSDTFLNGVDLPVVRAAKELESGDADRAVRALEPVKP